MSQVYNPYLPLYEYIPDGEPHVFGDRLYPYGSHDLFDGKKFCLGDYVCWSAPVDDLTAWRYEGVIYRAVQDPRCADGTHQLWAPDVVRGKDGRYYLYYCPDDTIRSIGVAVRLPARPALRPSASASLDGANLTFCPLPCGNNNKEHLEETSWNRSIIPICR